MLNTFKLSLLFLVLSSLLWNCRTLSVQKPAETYKVPDYKPTPSIINLPIEIVVKDIENSLNKNFTGLIYEDNKLEDDNLMVKAWKRENLSIEMDNNQLSYRVPIKIWVKAGFKIEQFGITVSNYKELEAEIAIKFKTSFTLNKDWTIKTTTTSNGYEWISKPVIKLGPIDLPITSIADIILKSNQQKIGSLIDKQVNQIANLKKYANDAWMYMQKPQKISDEYNLWLKLTPIEAFTEPILAKNGKIDFKFGIKTLSETMISAQAPVATTTPLPELKVSNKLDNQFLINLGVDLPFSTVDEMAKKELLNQTFTEGNKHITIKALDVFGATDTLIIHAKIEGSINGDIYLKGKPIFNALTETIEFAEIDYELKTKNALLKSANWLYHSGFSKMLKEKMKFPISGKITEYKKLVQQNITNKQINGNINLNGILNTLTINNICITPGSIKVYLLVNGKLQVNVKGF